jgi:hypothetical protein
MGVRFVKYHTCSPILWYNKVPEVYLGTLQLQNKNDSVTERI